LLVHLLLEQGVLSCYCCLCYSGLLCSQMPLLLLAPLPVQLEGVKAQGWQGPWALGWAVRWAETLMAGRQGVGWVRQALAAMVQLLAWWQGWVLPWLPRPALLQALVVEQAWQQALAVALAAALMEVGVVPDEALLRLQLLLLLAVQVLLLALLWVVVYARQ
jgi:hypothetical protein